MVTVISRFRVANGMRAEVEAAFKHRPGLVDGVPGFRGIEIHSDVCDPDIFYLYTVWEELDNFQQWHKSAAHHESHCGIPKGLKLDPTFTQIRVLYESSGDAAVEAKFVTSFITKSHTTYLVEVDHAGIIRHCSASFTEAIGLSAADLKGRPFVSLLVEDDAITIAKVLESTQTPDDILCNIVPADSVPLTIRCRVLHQAGRVLILGERLIDDEATALRQIIELNNELARLARTAQQQNRELSIAKQELATALAERDQSFWFIRKLHEVLPICMGCNKVRPGKSRWQDVVEFLHQNTKFLSHSYCPECLEKWKRGEI